jgi:hypothetical protein
MKETIHMHKGLLAWLLAAGLSATALDGASGAELPPSAPGNLVPLPLKLPDPSYKGTPSDLPSGPGIEPLSDKPRAPFLAPPGTTNLALHQKVTLSDNAPFSGEPELITDGQKEAFDDQVVEMRKGTRYAQVDLGRPVSIYAIAIWHDHRFTQIFHDVIVQIADDPSFTQNVRTLFNNDMDNSSGLGAGTDREYFETREGKLIDAKGVKAQSVRCYSKGSTQSALNVLQEIEVYGLPAQ